MRIADNELNKSIPLVIALDNEIFDLVKATQRNAHYFKKISRDDFIKAYKEHGLHDIDFDKIYK